MTITEKAAYLKGLVEGQTPDAEAGEGKLWRVLSELVGDMAAELKCLRDDHDELAEKTEQLEEEVDFLGLLVEGYDEDEEDEEDEEDDAYYPFGNYSDYPDDDEDEDEEDSDEFGVSYEVECPNCGEVIEFSEEILDEGSVQCPNCGASLEFDTPMPEEDSDSPDDADSD